MRLINARSLGFEEYFEPKVPPYAILSHTWEEGQEVSYQDMVAGRGSSKLGYVKITQTARLALDRRIEYIWVDTCCIDKMSSAELTESINSMFRWYKHAQVCFVYLADLPDVVPGLEVSVVLGRCRWFKRGWTLQELIAPSVVFLYNHKWTYVGTKIDYLQDISLITGIDAHALDGRLPLRLYSVSKRMSWAAPRQTTRLEDMAYCLLGIFDVDMPLIYGEGTKAFLRLQQEITKQSTDLTIFAWEVDRQSVDRYSNLFATSPAAFIASRNIFEYDRSEVNPEFSVTNKGLRVQSELTMLTEIDPRTGGKTRRYSLVLGARRPDNGFTYDVGIALNKIAPNLYVRDGRMPLTMLNWAERDRMEKTWPQTFFICADHQEVSLLQGRSYTYFLTGAASGGGSGTFDVERVIPESHWDGSRRLLFRPRLKNLVVAAELVGFLPGGQEARFGLLIDNRPEFPAVAVFDWYQHSRMSTWLFRFRHLAESIVWSDVHLDLGGLPSLSNSATMLIGDTYLTLSASLVHMIQESAANGAEIYRVKLDVRTSSVAPVAQPQPVQDSLQETISHRLLDR